MAFFPRFKPNGPQLPAGHRAVRPDYDLELFEEIYEGRKMRAFSKSGTSSATKPLPGKLSSPRFRL